MAGVSQEFETLLKAAARGESWAMTRLFDAVRPSLLRFVARRLDSRVAVRVESADVVQDVLLLASGRLVAFVERRPLPFAGWLRQIALERIACVHRSHIRSKKRTVRREVRTVCRDEDPFRNTIVNGAVSRETSTNTSVEAEEQRARLKQRLEQLPMRDQELLRLRFFERLEVRVVAEQLGITPGALRMRQVRALRHLRRLLADDGQTR
jgi:RNA polymerase sigma-70 factor (ECF subfamily)